jgi:branched-chain amino acid transport system permease protein
VIFYVVCSIGAIASVSVGTWIYTIDRSFWLAGIAGVCLALSFTLTPSQIYAWVGVVFAAVMLGGLGSPLGPLAAGMVVGVSEAVTMAFASPSWAPIVSFSLLIALLLLRPGRN